ncbi:MAG: FomA family porin-like outer membrane protein [Cetobacterium sp.]
MKKNLIYLSAIFAITTMAQGKELVNYPKVEIVEVEDVNIIKEKTTFRPSGYLRIEYKGYGETEGHGDGLENSFSDTSVDPSIAQDEWNRGANNYSRLQTTFGVQATEKILLEGRIRDYNNLERDDESKDNSAKDGTETRMRLYYAHNNWLTSRIEYYNQENDDQELEYQLRMDLYKNKGAFVEKLVLAPKYYHLFPNSNGGNYINAIGADLEYAGNLPLGIKWDGTLYLDYYFYNQDIITGSNGNDREDKELVVEWEFYLRRHFELYTGNNYGINLDFEGGYDPYVFRQYDRYGFDSNKNSYVMKKSKNTYELYGQLAVSADYRVTENFVTTVGVGAEYRNWDNVNQDSASDWRWQPFAYVAMKTTF